MTLFAFDLLYLDGYDLRGAALAERKRVLKAVLETSERVRYSEHFEAGGREVLEAAREHGLEGILAKRAESRYASRRSGDWLKIKVVNQQEFVICGFAQGERERFGSLVLGVREDGRLVYAGPGAPWSESVSS